jgi:N-acetylmuramoyl-L-alanine amidase
VKRVLTVVFITLTLVFSSFGSYQSRSYKIRTVVIDPGHGGHDVGCLGTKTKEKDIALGISLKLGNYIEKNFTDIKVVYTRKTDVFVPLHERAAIANNSKADVFICIHCNSGPKDAYGTETYVMGLHRSEENLNVAKRENASVLMEDNYKAKYDGFDPNSPEANIIFNLYQNAFLEQSLILASKIQKDFREQAGRNSRGVRQAGFLVLYKTTMPSVLVETGFLTNASEEKFMSTPQGQDYLASSLFRAFKEYKREVEGTVVHKAATESTKSKPASPVNSERVASPPPVSTPTYAPISASPNESKLPSVPAGSQPKQQNTLSIDPDAPKTYAPKKNPPADNLSKPEQKTAEEPPAPAQVQANTGSSVFILPPDTVMKRKAKVQEKPKKPIDPEVAARAADRAEFEKYKQTKQTEDKVKKEAAMRLKKEMEEKAAADAEKLRIEAEEQALLLIEMDKKKKEEQIRLRQERERKAKEDYEMKVKMEMDRMRKQAEEELARKQAQEKAKLAAEIKAKLLEEQRNNVSSSDLAVSEEDETEEQKAERLRREKDIREREAKARAIAIELTKKNGNVKQYLTETKKKETPAAADKPGATYKDDPSLLTEGSSESEKMIMDVPYIDVERTFYGVQIVASPNPYMLNDEVFKGLKALAVDKTSDKMYKYIYGKVYTFAEAVSLQKEMRDRGFKDAFVVAYSKGKRVTVQEARILLKDINEYKAVPYEMDNEGKSQKKESGVQTQEKKSGSVIHKYSSEFVNVRSFQGLIYVVEIAASQQPVSLTSPMFKGLTEDINRDVSEENNIRYSIGSYPSFKTANEARKNIRSKGFPEAQVVAYKNGVRMETDEARLLTKNE